MASIGTTRVEDVMVTKVITVKEVDTMESVSVIFERNDINAAPVVNEAGKCVGIITSHDVVEYESIRSSVQSELNHGTSYDLAHYGNGVDVRLPGLHFHEVGFHMTKTIRTASVEQPLSMVAKGMCAHHIHHVLVLDETEKPIGMLSSLDILGFVIGEPVCRTSQCPTEI